MHMIWISDFLISLHFEMCADMSVKMTGLGERLSTDRTLVAPLSRVYSHVDLKVTTRVECPLAERTFVWLFSSVCSHVNAHATVAGQYFLTDSALHVLV